MGCQHEATPTQASQGTFEELINSLANRNDPPKIEQKRLTQPGQPDGDVPLFPRSYDWDEESRVRRMIARLGLEDSEAEVQCLAEHVADERYCTTYEFDGYVHVASIGRLCWQKVAYDLQFPFWECSPGVDVGNQHPQLKPIRSPDDVRQWCNAHKNVPLYEQQIELCNMAIQRIETIVTAPPLTKSEIDHFKAAVTEKIAAQRRQSTANSERAASRSRRREAV